MKYLVLLLVMVFAVPGYSQLFKKSKKEKTEQTKEKTEKKSDKKSDKKGLFKKKKDKSEAADTGKSEDKEKPDEKTDKKEEKASEKNLKSTAEASPVKGEQKGGLGNLGLFKKRDSDKKKQVPVAKETNKEKRLREKRLEDQQKKNATVGTDKFGRALKETRFVPDKSTRAAKRNFKSKKQERQRAKRRAKKRRSARFE